jgi:germination protein M
MIGSSPLRRLAVVGVFGLAVGVVGAACGDDDGSSSDTSDTTATVSTSETPATSEQVAQVTTSSEPGPETTTTGTVTDTVEDVAPTTVAATTTTTTTTTAEPATTTGPDTTTATRQRLRTTRANVYWGWTVLNPAAGSPERIGAGARDVASSSPVSSTLTAMFDGVDAVEREIGMVSSIPEGTRVLGISVHDGTATVDLSAEFEAPDGTLGESMRLAQVVFAVTQFDGFDRVKFHIAGEPRGTILSHGFEVGDGLTRDDFPDVRARIMVEEPSPGSEVTDPLVIRGESNTFEGTVRYAVTGGGGDGIVLTEGFTTATAGMGTWGTFEIAVDLADLSADYVPGPGSVILWEDDPRTGDRVDVVEIPIVLPAR